MSEPTSPHDHILRETLAHEDSAQEFVANYLPKRIAALLDARSAERLPDSFIESTLTEHLADILYRVKLKSGGDAFIYVLIEHKSSPDHMVAFQLLRYMVRIWETYGGQTKRLLPPILPIVFYHGAEKWKVAPNLAAIIDLDDAEPLREYSPDLKYYLFDLADYPAEQIRGGRRLQVVLRSMKYIFSSDAVERLAETLRAFGEFSADDQDAVELIRTILVYWSAARGLTKQDVDRAIEINASQRTGDDMATVLDEYVQHGIKQGLAQGIKEGERKEAAAIALRLLQARLGSVPHSTEEAVRALPVDLLEELTVPSWTSPISPIWGAG